MEIQDLNKFHQKNLYLWALWHSLMMTKYVPVLAFVAAEPIFEARKIKFFQNPTSQTWFF